MNHSDRSSVFWTRVGIGVYVTVTQGKATATFCNIEFSSATFNLKTTASISITEK
ncbi:MAG: hypothetical protein KF862_06775 [Chitinophagaceae bacterium]|nr:hypothetical protein [Chitinophagaceae bacterium]